MKKTRKILATILAVALASLMVFSCTVFAEENQADLPTYNWNLGTMFYDPVSSPDFNSDGELVQRFVDLLDEYSGGRIKVTVHWASVLGGTNELLEMVRTGDLELATGGAITAVDQRFGVFSIPGMVDDMDMAEALVYEQDGGYYLLMHDIFADNNTELLSSNIGQFRGLFNNRGKVVVPEDAKGLLLRAYADEIVTTYWNGLCNTTILPISELYTALQLGTVDGLEFNPCAMIANGYTDVLDYYTDIDWQWSASQNILMNMDLFKSLSEDDQAIVKKAAYDACGYYNELFKENLEKAYDYMSENGIEVYQLTDDERAEWTAYAATLTDQFKAIVGEDIYNQAAAVGEEYRANK